MKTVLITGGTRGIGRASSLRFAAEGFAVIANYTKNETAAKTLEEEIKKSGGTVMTLRADVADAADRERLVSEALSLTGKIDVLVNNAGIVKDEYLLMLTTETLDKCLDLNIKGYLYCAQQAVLKMFRQKSGVIVNMSSVSAKMALAGQSVYSATKGAVNSMTQTMAKELARYGIRVNAVAPGFVLTEMVDQLPEDKKKEYIKAVPMGRFADVSEVADVVSFLCSDDSKYITGQSIVVDGGLSL